MNFSVGNVGDMPAGMPLRLAVGCAKVAFDPNVVIVDQVTVQFGHRALGNASKEYDQASLFYHMNALRLGGIDRSGGDDLSAAFSVCLVF